MLMEARLAAVMQALGDKPCFFDVGYVSSMIAQRTSALGSVLADCTIRDSSSDMRDGRRAEHAQWPSPNPSRPPIAAYRC